MIVTCLATCTSDSHSASATITIIASQVQRVLHTYRRRGGHRIRDLRACAAIVVTVSELDVIVVEEAIVLVATTGVITTTHYQVVAWTCRDGTRRVVAQCIVCAGHRVRTRKWRSG